MCDEMNSGRREDTIAETREKETTEVERDMSEEGEKRRDQTEGRKERKGDEMIKGLVTEQIQNGQNRTEQSAGKT